MEQKMLGTLTADIVAAHVTNKSRRHRRPREACRQRAVIEPSYLQSAYMEVQPDVNTRDRLDTLRPPPQVADLRLAAARSIRVRLVNISEGGLGASARASSRSERS